MHDFLHKLFPGIVQVIIANGMVAWLDSQFPFLAGVPVTRARDASNWYFSNFCKSMPLCGWDLLGASHTPPNYMTYTSQLYEIHLPIAWHSFVHASGSGLHWNTPEVWGQCEIPHAFGRIAASCSAQGKSVWRLLYRMHCVGNSGNSCEFWRLSLEKPIIIRVFRPIVQIMMDFCGFFSKECRQNSHEFGIPYTMHPVEKSPISATRINERQNSMQSRWRISQAEGLQQWSQHHFPSLQLGPRSEGESFEWLGGADPAAWFQAECSGKVPVVSDSRYSCACLFKSEGTSPLLRP